MADAGVSGAADEEAEAVVDAFGELGDGEGSGQTGGQFDREGEAVDGGADRVDFGAWLGGAAVAEEFGGRARSRATRPRGRGGSCRRRRRR